MTEEAPATVDVTPVTPITPVEAPAPVADARITPPAEAPAFTIPEAYKDKPWASKIKSEEDLYKQIDGLQSVVGKKTVAPDFANATPKEIEDFYNSLRPADKAEYKFTDDTPEQMRNVYADLLHANGIGAFQAENLVKQFNEVLGAQAKSLYDPEGFNKVLETSFGKDYKNVGGEVARNIASNLNDADKKLLETMPNEQLGVLYRFADKIIKAYGATESGAQTNSNSTTPPPDIKESQKSIRAEIDALTKRPHTAAEKNALVEKLYATYKK